MSFLDQTLFIELNIYKRNKNLFKIKKTETKTITYTIVE
jgi:hypothetical protein